METGIIAIYAQMVLLEVLRVWPIKIIQVRLIDVKSSNELKNNNMQFRFTVAGART